MDLERQRRKSREWARRNRGRINAYIKDRVERRRAELLEGESCQTCGERDHRVLQFHHRDPSTKKFKLGGCELNRKWEAILQEREKCDVLCANCHIRLHYDERHTEDRAP